MWTVFHTESSLGWGGQETRILSESLGMRERGHRIIMLTPQQSMLSKKSADCGFENITVSFEKPDYPKIFFKVLSLIEQMKPDFINTHSSRDSWIVSLASRASKYKPFIIRTRHLSTPVARNIFGSTIYKFLPHKIITTGESIREQLIEDNNVFPGKIISIPTGIDLNRFNPNRKYKDIRNTLSLPQQTPLVGMVSVLRSWKGHDYFINAAEHISKTFPQIKFLIVGDGPRKDDLKKIIHEKKRTYCFLR